MADAGNSNDIAGYLAGILSIVTGGLFLHNAKKLSDLSEKYVLKNDFSPEKYILKDDFSPEKYVLKNDFNHAKNEIREDIKGSEDRIMKAIDSLHTRLDRRRADD